MKKSKTLREIETGKSYNSFHSNYIRTSKYTCASFVPRNLLEQFTKISNVFFLVLSIMQMVRPISITDGFPTILPVLIIIIILSAVKDFFEDYKRWISDRKENNSPVERFLFKDVHAISNQNCNLFIEFKLFMILN